MSINDFKVKIGNFDIKLKVNRNEIRRRENIRKNFEQDKRIREMLDNRYKNSDGSVL